MDAEKVQIKPMAIAAEGMQFILPSKVIVLIDIVSQRTSSTTDLVIRTLWQKRQVDKSTSWIRRISPASCRNWRLLKT
jgi:hypothetical protein